MSYVVTEKVFPGEPMHKSLNHIIIIFISRYISYHQGIISLPSTTDTKHLASGVFQFILFGHL